jgi:hypothetical protein
MSIMNNKAIIVLFQDKVTTCCWMRFLRIPTTGSGAVATAPATTPKGRLVSYSDLGDFKILNDDFHHITMEQMMAFVGLWAIGCNSSRLVLRWIGTCIT